MLCKATGNFYEFFHIFIGYFRGLKPKQEKGKTVLEKKGNPAADRTGPHSAQPASRPSPARAAPRLARRLLRAARPSSDQPAARPLFPFSSIFSLTPMAHLSSPSSGSETCTNTITIPNQNPMNLAIFPFDSACFPSYKSQHTRLVPVFSENRETLARF
jgi:hypothetical protein